jgi:hypothetical protein
LEQHSYHMFENRVYCGARLRVALVVHRILQTLLYQAAEILAIPKLIPRKDNLSYISSFPIRHHTQVFDYFFQFVWEVAFE